MSYVSNQVGSDYLDWSNQFILLSTHTGSGKTTFILRTLLKYAIAQGKYILYICNRVLLEKQIANDSKAVLKEIYNTDSLTAEQKNHFIIRTYQYFEKNGFREPFLLPDQKHSVLMKDIRYVIWDEAHYLGSEDFNPNFNFWFDCFSNPIGFPDPKSIWGTHIFLTATPEPFLLFLGAHIPKKDSVQPLSGILSFDSDFQVILKEFQVQSRSYRKAREAAQKEDQYAQAYREAYERYEKAVTMERSKAFRAAVEQKKREEQERAAGKRVIHISLNTDKPLKPPIPKTLPEHETSAYFKQEAQAIQPGRTLLKRVMTSADLIRVQKTVDSNFLPDDSLIQRSTDYPERNTSSQDIKGNVFVEYPNQFSFPYQKMPVSVFGSLLSLIPLMLETAGPDIAKPEKWLVFIDDESEGAELRGALNALGISSVLLSSKKLASRRKYPDANNEFHHIVHKSQFHCRVLISTSIMDCGVNIKDPAVRHVVLSHANRIAAMQMLGRKRLDPGEQIHIYFRFYQRKALLSYLHSLKEQLRLLVEYADRKAVNYLSHKKFRSDPDDYRTLADTRPVYNNRHRQQTAEELIRGHQAAYLYRPSKILLDTASTGDIIEQYEIGKSSFFYLLYRIFELEAVLAPNSARDPLCYIRYQFSWVHQPQAVIQWVEAETLCRKLADYQNKLIIRLSSRRSVALPDGAVSSDDFLEDCMQVLHHLPRFTPLLEKYLSKQPQKKAFNAILQELFIPYEITAGQSSIQNTRYTVWHIHSTEITIRNFVQDTPVKDIPPDLPPSEATPPQPPVNSLVEMFKNWEKAYAAACVQSFKTAPPKKGNCHPKRSSGAVTKRPSGVVIKPSIDHSKASEIHPDFTIDKN